jgi:hypothetical protein
MKLVKFTIPSGRDILINPDQIVYVCADPLGPDKTQLYLSNQDFYQIKLPLEEVLRLLKDK